MATTAVIPTFVADVTTRTAGVFPTFLTNQLTFSMTGSGGILVGGAAQIFGDAFIPSGGILASGVATVVSTNVLRFEMYGRDGAFVSGGATVVFNPFTGIGVGGGASVTAIQVQKYIIAGVGGISASGVALVSELIPFKPTGGITLYGAVSPTNIIVVPVGGLVLVSGTAIVSTNINAVPTGGFSLTGTAAIIYVNPLYIPAGGVSVSGSALAFLVPRGGVVTLENPYNADFNGWAINYETNAPSRYERLAANSMCVIDGITYVSNAGGIYAVDADNDAGQDIQASVSFGNSDFGEHNSKRIAAAYFGMRSDYKMRLTIVANRQSAYYFDIEPPRLSEHGSRLTPGKGLAGLFFAIRLDNQRGKYFEFDALTLELAVSNRMGL